MMDQIDLFLKLAKEYARNYGVIVVDRQEIKQFIRSRGITDLDIAQIVFELTRDDIFDGPEADRDPKYSHWTVAECSPYFRGEKLYFKLSITVIHERCKCLSIKLYTEREM